MKRSLTLAAAMLGVLMLGPATILAGHSDGDGGDEDFVRGTGQIDSLIAEFGIHVNARDTEPTGHFWAKIETSPVTPPADISGRVTCLNVVLNLARVGGVITKTTDPVAFPVGSGFVAAIVDNGEPGEGTDRMNGARITNPPTVCTATPPPVPITSGNYVVHDGQLP